MFCKVPPSMFHRWGDFSRSKLAEHMLRTGDFEASAFFDIELLDNAIIDDNRITLAAIAHAVAGEIGKSGQKHRFFCT